MWTSLAGVIPGWTHEVTVERAPHIAAGVARESARLRGRPFVLVLVRSRYDQDGLLESVELLDPVDDLQEGAVRAEAAARVRAETCRAEHDWRELSVGGARALPPLAEAPVLAVRKVGDGSGINSMYVRVAVLPLAGGGALDADFVRRVGLDAELADWFATVAARRV